VATIWYIVLTTLLSIGQYQIERHYARGTRRRDERGFWQIARANLPLFQSRAGLS
jgi:polar amino acid transport system permease protein